MAGFLAAGKALAQFTGDSDALRQPGKIAGGSDSDPESLELRNRLHRQWLQDAELAKARHKRVGLRSDRKKSRIGVMSAVSGGDPYVYFPSGTANDGKLLALAGS